MTTQHPETASRSTAIPACPDPQRRGCALPNPRVATTHCHPDRTAGAVCQHAAEGSQQHFGCTYPPAIRPQPHVFLTPAQFPHDEPHLYPLFLIVQPVPLRRHSCP